MPLFIVSYIERHSTKIKLSTPAEILKYYLIRILVAIFLPLRHLTSVIYLITISQVRTNNLPVYASKLCDYVLALYSTAIYFKLQCQSLTRLTIIGNTRRTLYYVLTGLVAIDRRIE